MPTDHDPIRRAMFAAIAAAAPLGTVAAPATARTGAAPSGARSLVAVSYTHLTLPTKA